MEGRAASLRLRCRSYVVIPARLASTRLPGKMLLRETGKPLIQHTYEAACQASRPLGVIVATDHASIADEVATFAGDCQLTSPAARSGTDRVAEVAARMEHVDIFVNVQGDEPEIAGSSIDQVIELLERHPDAVMATLATPIRSRRQLEDPSCVKVVFDHAGRALYFSRSPIPHAREWRDELLAAEPPHFFQHLGIYAYRRDFLLRISDLPPSDTESLESLEQLRVLHAGHSILVGVTNHQAVGIDTWDDYRAFVSRTGTC
jgi:3-deoxy-manno-octulosonate cytidylyltransferase (CMP-KDO synthetase)